MTDKTRSCPSFYAVCVEALCVFAGILEMIVLGILGVTGHVAAMGVVSGVLSATCGIAMITAVVGVFLVLFVDDNSEDSQ